METKEDAPFNLPRLPQGLKAFVALIFVVGTLAAGYQTTQTPVTLIIDGQAQHVQTHQDTVAGLLMDAGLTLHPKDIVAPSPQTSIEPDLTVEVQRARPVQISADGHTVLLHTHAASAEEVLEEAHVSLGPHDQLEVEGELPLTSRSNPSHGSPAHSEIARRSTVSPEPESAHITIHRAIPFTLHEDGEATTFYTIAPTVGEALYRAGLRLYLADGVRPGLGERISAGMDVYVNRSMPVVVQVDGRTIRTRTHRERVGDVLADLNIVLTGQDYTIPPVDASLDLDDTIRVVRVSERFLIQQEPIPFESVWQPDPNLEIDHQRVLQEGAPGVWERRVRVRYEDGHEVSRTLENEYVAIPPTTKINGYGTKIVIHTLDTPSGPVEYWRVIRMLATSYSAGTSGTSPSSPWYGRTATGMEMGHGIVAVDPRVINLRSRVYVPGYGVGVAGDTGGAIKGRRIDVGFDDDNLELWYRWVDVYLLTPVPDRVNYVLEP